MELLEDEIRRHHGPERLIGDVADRVIDNAQLGAQLGRGSRHVRGAQGVLPKAPSDRQQGIVLDDDVAVFRAGRDGRAGELAVDLAGMGSQAFLDRLDPVSLLGQDDTPGDGSPSRSESSTGW